MANIFDKALNRWRALTTDDLPGAGGGGGGDASAANQATQITLETAIRDRLPVGGTASEATLNSLLTMETTTAARIGATDEVAAASDTASTGLNGLIRRLMTSRFGLLIAGRSPVDTLGQPSVARQLAVSGTTANQALTSTCRRITIRARGCPMRYEVGVGTQTANATTSHFIDQDERLDLSVPAGAHIAAIAIPTWGGSTTGTGSLAITELV